MFKKLSETIEEKYSHRHGLGKQLEIVKVFDIYRGELKKIFPDDLETKPVNIRNKTMTVKTSCSAAANELRFREQEIVEKINIGLKKVVVKRIIYRF